jgi:hypothetical protein
MTEPQTSSPNFTLVCQTIDIVSWESGKSTPVVPRVKPGSRFGYPPSTIAINRLADQVRLRELTKLSTTSAAFTTLSAGLVIRAAISRAR